MHRRTSQFHLSQLVPKYTALMPTHATTSTLEKLRQPLSPSLSVLVAIEMFNSLNALSEDGSLLTMPPWVNPWLLLAMSLSFGLYFLILYVPFLAQVFGIVPLSLNERLLVVLVAFPVILIDEVLKLLGWCTTMLRRSQAGKLKAE
ncbi:hypothetical protein Nepgr_014617 [Nepenthes gracilis]|uniref:Cation-transporting P-type ATPase C-terminal domain-containing protein n=1 Tax=Nepenthes gracilis TaxID=150966 RepID=A0AAD3SM62_NEPGR|nr:hypothetical protein Nepgr_014617 [Nepenthes gracilis]